MTTVNPAARPARAASGYRMRAMGTQGEVYLYGVIGQTFFSDGVSAKQFADDLKALGAVSALDVRINSEGGDVFEGRTIYSLLNEHPAKITVYVDGLAASIASLIAMAGDEILMGDGTFMMIHNAWGGCCGEAADMRRMADLLDSVSQTLIDTYASRTKNKAADIKQMMDDETWMTAADAVKQGFATKVTDPTRVAASLRRPEAFRHLPAALRKNRTAAAGAIAKIAAFTGKA
jgi:ATP-dependent Clp protease, protease subunit